MYKKEYHTPQRDTVRMGTNMLRPGLEQLVTFLFTRDLEETSAFYEGTLGLAQVLDQGSCRIYQVADNAFLGFCKHLETAAPSGVILTLVSSQVDEWATYLRQQGIALEKEPAHNPRFNIYHLFVRDPNGYLIEIQRFLDPSWPAGISKTAPKSP
jgi:catechol 2,3-dioxygenase-like lactoylglutathione lyase family enzyme